jgi:hypothetical protein
MAGRLPFVPILRQLVGFEWRLIERWASGYGICSRIRSAIRAELDGLADTARWRGAGQSRGIGVSDPLGNFRTDRERDLSSHA